MEITKRCGTIGEPNNMITFVRTEEDGTWILNQDRWLVVKICGKLASEATQEEVLENE